VVGIARAEARRADARIAAGGGWNGYGARIEIRVRVRDGLGIGINWARIGGGCREVSDEVEARVRVEREELALEEELVCRGEDVLYEGAAVEQQWKLAAIASIRARRRRSRP
jgi:hypothetical protein